MMANKDAEVSRLNGVFADMLLTAGTGQAQDPSPPMPTAGNRLGQSRVNRGPTVVHPERNGVAYPHLCTS